MLAIDLTGKRALIVDERSRIELQLGTRRVNQLNRRQ